MPVERADFDDLVTLVTQAPPWEKDRVQGVRILLRAIGEGTARRARPDPRALDVAARARGAQGAGPQGERRVSRRRSGCSARSRTRAATGTRRTRRSSSTAAKELPLAIAAALLASAEGYTPRANHALEAAREELGTIAGDRERARRQPARAEGAPGPPPAPAPQEEAATSAHAAQQNGGAPEQAPRRSRSPSRPPSKARTRNNRAGYGSNNAAMVLAVARHRLRRRAGHGGLAVRPAGAADRARGRRVGRTGAGRSRSSPGSWSASPSSRSSPPGCSTSSACRRTCCATSRSRCSS